MMNDQSDQEIIEQVISLEVDYNSETTGIMAGACGDVIGTTGVVSSNNQYTSSSSDDFYHLLMDELIVDRDVSSTVAGQQVVTSEHQLSEPDERMRIENIRKQLMSCEVQSDSNMSPLCSMNTVTLLQQQSACQQPQQQQQLVNQQQSAPQPPQQHQTQLATSPQAPVIIHHQHQMSAVSPQMPNDSLIQASYSTISNVPTSIPVSSGQTYVPPQHIARISPQPSGIVTNSWQSQQQPQQQQQQQPQQQQMHNFQPMRQPQQQKHVLQQQQQQQQSQQTMQQPHSNHQQQITAPAQIPLSQQQMHHPMQRSPLEAQHTASPVPESQSPVVAKNPMLNAHLAKNPPTRFMGNILNQNPMLNEQLNISQVPFVTSTANSRIGSMNSQSRFIQSQSNLNFQPQQPQNQQQPQQMSLYGMEANQNYRNVNTPTLVNMADSSSNTGGVVSPQTKLELRRKVHQQQPRNQQTSLLKQLLSENDK